MTFLFGIYRNVKTLIAIVDRIVRKFLYYLCICAVGWEYSGGAASGEVKVEPRIPKRLPNRAWTTGQIVLRGKVDGPYVAQLRIIPLLTLELRAL